MSDTAQKFVGDIVGDTLDVVEETLETVERIPKLRLNGTTRNQQIVILSATALTGAVVGGVTTYFVVKKRLEYKYEELARVEVQTAKKFYSRLHKTDEFADPQTLIEQAADAAASYAPTDGGVPETPTQGRVKQQLVDYTAFSTPPVAPEEEAMDKDVLLKQVAEGLANQGQGDDPNPDVERAVEVFRESAATDGFDYDTELQRRQSLPIGVPYLITAAEFIANPDDHDQDTLVYYERDEILANSRDMPVDDDIIDSDNLARFGEGSGDHTLVYVRNPVLEMDFAVRKSDGSFAKQVHDIDEEHLEHGDGMHRGVRKMRRER